MQLGFYHLFRGFKASSLGMGHLWWQPKWYVSLESNAYMGCLRLGKMGIIHTESFKINFCMSSYVKHMHSPLGVIYMTIFLHLWQCEEVLICALMSQTGQFKVALNLNKNWSFNIHWYSGI